MAETLIDYANRIIRKTQKGKVLTWKARGEMGVENLPNSLHPFLFPSYDLHLAEASYASLYGSGILKIAINNPNQRSGVTLDLHILNDRITDHLFTASNFQEGSYADAALMFRQMNRDEQAALALSLLRLPGLNPELAKLTDKSPEIIYP